MIDAKLETLLVLAETKNYTRAAQELSLTQPAVSHHIQLLEQEFNTKVFTKDKGGLKLTQEGQLLLQYARRSKALYLSTQQAVEDVKKLLRHLSLGITPTAGDSLLPQIMAQYCNAHPSTHIQIITDSIKNLYSMLATYELDAAIIDGHLEDSPFTSVLLDTDYLCLIVSPDNPLAKADSVPLSRLKKENFILRSRTAGTRQLFENYLLSRGENIRNFNVIIEIDNVGTIRELVAKDLGISVMAHSACREDLLTGSLKMVSIENFSMIREINLLCRKDFTHSEILEEFRHLYASVVR